MSLLELGALFPGCDHEVLQVFAATDGRNSILSGSVLSRSIHDQDRLESKQFAKIFLIPAFWIPKDLIHKNGLEEVEKRRVLLA